MTIFAQPDPDELGLNNIDLNELELKSHQRFWQDFYKKQQLPWDLNGPTPQWDVWQEEAPSFWQSLALGKLLIPGAGRGHDAVYFAEKGFNVTAIDYAQGSLVSAQAAYPDWVPEKIDYRVKDLFSLNDQISEYESFDYWVEHTCFCAIPPKKRIDYCTMAAFALKPGGLILGIFWQFEENVKNGPPYSSMPEEILACFEPTFECVELTPCLKTAGGRSGTEYRAVFKKRGIN